MKLGCFRETEKGILAQLYTIFTQFKKKRNLWIKGFFWDLWFASSWSYNTSLESFQNPFRSALVTACRKLCGTYSCFISNTANTCCGSDTFFFLSNWMQHCIKTFKELYFSTVPRSYCASCFALFFFLFGDKDVLFFEACLPVSVKAI